MPEVRSRFNEAYYHRFYRNPATRVHDARGQARLAGLVFAWMDYLNLPVRRVLDLGCGLGHWRRAVAARHPAACYTGVESSEYLCRRFGWELGTASGWRGRGRYDLVICQSVLQYLDREETLAAIANLSRLCRGGLYLEALTREDWEEHCNRKVTDGRVHLRPAAWYRRALSRHFRTLGGGFFLPRDTDAMLYSLESG